MSDYLRRIKMARSSVEASPFYTPEQREAVLFILYLIEHDEPPPSPNNSEDHP